MEEDSTRVRRAGVGVPSALVARAFYTRQAARPRLMTSLNTDAATRPRSATACFTAAPSGDEGAAGRQPRPTQQ